MQSSRQNCYIVGCKNRNDLLDTNMGLKEVSLHHLVCIRSHEKAQREKLKLDKSISKLIILLD